MSALRQSLPFCIALITPVVGLALGVHPQGLVLALLPLIVFVVLPVIDLVGGRERALIEETPTARDWRYDLWLWCWVPLQLIAIAHAVIVFGTSTTLSMGATVAGAVSIGLMTGVGINVAHELMHRRGRFERALAEVLMTSATYTHFCVEHVLGHHKHVATPLDPASSRASEGLYTYLPRTLLGGLRSAWRIESKRVAAAKLGVSLRDRRLRYAVVLVVVYVAIGVFVGAGGVVFFAAQSAVAMTLLEIINYVEHYGLARRELSPGRYERCLPAHSWNASERVTNWFLFHLQRHADHHHVASRPYYALRHVDESPQLPTGYPGMILLALVPPLWRRVMDPRVAAWKAQAPTTNPPQTSTLEPDVAV